jgi:hypothetical protein
MRIGVSLFLIAAGAILRWAVTDHVNNVNLSTVGVILMVVGVAGLVISLALSASRRRTDVIHHSNRQFVDQVMPADSHTTYIEPSAFQPRG